MTRRAFRLPLGRYLPPMGSSFVYVEVLGGIVLLGATVAALLWANLARVSYVDLWSTHLTIGIGDLSITEDLQHWVNDGLMTVFFFVVGLEIKRELVRGELRDPRTASLPAIAAAGGMVLPALLYLSVNASGAGGRGGGAGVGDPHGDRHRVRGRDPRDRRRPRARQPQAVPAHARNRRRRRRD